ncbi:hypothetical protein FB45DRAFT_886796 [Roridomyces roridus]|uniref:Antibiotic biosynthesis monooxygenase n=1 Tax=Roridomyces roridus TaxID=1738132 RepID=A0AAD7CIM2_9AGAR|nr:hypothetical protein FB45DRAFT_886796 [Roridomyces roridus]
MPSSQVSLALFVPLIAKREKVDEVSAFLGAGYDLVQAEPDTIQWFGVKYADHTPPTYAIFDTFRAESGRGAHLSGKVAEALMANAGALLAAGPDIMSNNILANKVVEGAKVGVGLRVLLTAKPEKVDEVREFLTGALPLVEAEPGTLVWYAIEFPGTNKFGIVDFFADETGRNAHIGGKVAEALFANADAMLVSPPDLVKVDVVASSVKV